MFPKLLDLGVFQIQTYGACMALGFILCVKLLEKISKRKDLSNLFIYLLLGGVLGSRINYVILNWQTEFASNPAAIIRVDQGGLVFYGGLILSIIIFFVWCYVKKEPPLKLADLLCAILPLGHAFGRIGCFFYGCCWGRISNSPFAVSFPRHSPAWCEQVNNGLIKSSALESLPVLPTQLFEAASLFLLFAILLFIYLKKRSYTAGVYLCSYALLRFAIEYLRDDPRGEFLGLSTGQLTSIAMIIIGCVFIFISYKKRLKS